MNKKFKNILSKISYKKPMDEGQFYIPELTLEDYKQSGK